MVKMTRPSQPKPTATKGNVDTEENLIKQGLKKN
jgi:hypothetical protein